MLKRFTLAALLLWTLSGSVLAVDELADGFLDEFQKYRGYDARPYLPALAGHTVGCPEISDPGMGGN